MKPGMILSQPLIPDQIEAAQLAEANGFDSVWATEFFHQRQRQMVSLEYEPACYANDGGASSIMTYIKGD
jgi:alkanesulfonate monooxygenase SsuD/methylene tetrahydromethanopterin reductase-like flavin-dependent oxidoreductase (luciferase family)